MSIQAIANVVSNLYGRLCLSFSGNVTADIGIAGIQTVLPAGQNYNGYNITADVALTIGIPSPKIIGSVLVIRIKNSTGGALTTQPAFNAIYHTTGALPAIANGQQLLVAFYFDFSANVYYEMYRALLTT